MVIQIKMLSTIEENCTLKLVCRHEHEHAHHELNFTVKKAFLKTYYKRSRQKSVLYSVSLSNGQCPCQVRLLVSTPSSV